MKIKPATIELDDDQRGEIARYFDGSNDKPWYDADGCEVEGAERLATHAECARYVNFALPERLEYQELHDHANQAEGAI